MKKMNYMDTYNAIVGGIVAVLSFVFGEHWILFAIFLLFNIADWITGWMKSRMAGKENSMKGWQGVLKKLGYWLMILVAFAASAVFIEIGNTLGMDLGVTTLLGYFVLASLLVNELRSILENFVEAGYNVPTVLVKGLEVADKVVNQEQE
ncbi:phage holin family protein [Clostridium sp. C1]|uniref:phage holin family protein n=1 Tax=Clostridium sp. C1 TaxID=1155388 RepID=UPI001BACE57C|nr:phage holin family protein [Clostridium sp. C1]QUN14512.1 phage holin family protein [Clostridium sp. C1]